MDRNVCSNIVSYTSDEYSLVWISFLALLLSMVSFVAFLFYFYGMAQHLEKMQKVYDRRVQEAEYN